MNWINDVDQETAKRLAGIWIAVGTPGYAGIAKAQWKATLDARYGADGWRISHYVRGKIVPKMEAIKEYEASYRHYIRANPALVDFLTKSCGNVYDDNVSNVYDDDYEQPHTAMNHYQDISTRQVIAELVEDPEWPTVTETARETVTLTDLNDGQKYEVPRASGMAGSYLMQIRDSLSAGFMLNPAVVPVHDPLLITSLPDKIGWYHHEGCGHLSVEAFWQMSKVIEVRYDRFLALGDERITPLAGVEETKL